jgi:hypothetical protein
MKSPSFKAELAAFRRHLEPPSKYKDPAYQQAFAKKQKLFFRVVDEWTRYPGVEDLWHKISAKLPADYSAPRFIAEVLQQRDFAEDLDRVTEGLADVEQKNASRTKRLLKEAKGASKVENLKQIAIENALLASTIEDRGRILSRKSETAARQYFSATWSKRFMELCGQPLDDVVSALVLIAFQETMSVDAVRLARKSEPRIHPSK